MKLWHLFIAASAFSLANICLTAHAQSSSTDSEAATKSATKPAKSPATVQAFGEHLLELNPERVRLILIAKAEGSTAKEAVERLAKHKAAVRGELTAMKAEAKSVRITSSDMRRHVLGVPPQYQHMNAKFFSNILEGPLNMRFEDLPIVHTATCVVEADWILSEGNSDTVLQLPNSLREQVTQRDLIGDDNGLELSPEQSANVAKFKEAIDEHMGYYDDSTQQDQQVHVLFVATVKPDARAAALKSAYEKARQECELLATVSGHKLGRLVSVTKPSPDDFSNNFSLGIGADTSDAMSVRLNASAQREETTSQQSDGLQARFQVRATFELE